MESDYQLYYMLTEARQIKKNNLDMNAHFKAVMSGEFSPIPKGMDHIPMEELFQKIIEHNRMALNKYKTITSNILIVVTDPETGKHKFLSFPIATENDLQKDMMSIIIRGIINDILNDKTKDFVLSAVIQILDAHMEQFPAEAIDAKTGELKPEYKMPSESKSSKNVLMFCMEQEFFSRTVTYEYIESDSGDIVISEKPIIDSKDAYDARRKGRFSNFFTHGQAMN